MGEALACFTMSWSLFGTAILLVVACSALPQKKVDEVVPEFTTQATVPKPRLFCFSVAVPGIGEPHLIKEQARHRAEDAGLWGCDDFAILTNVSSFGGETASAVDKHVVSVFKGPMTCKMGHYKWQGPGDSKAIIHTIPLNAPIFKQGWAHLLGGAVNLDNFDYVVKLDPDAVFSAVRLRNTLTTMNLLSNEPLFVAPFMQHPHGLKTYLGGPIEVMSRAATQLLAEALQKKKSGTGMCAFQPGFPDPKNAVCHIDKKSACDETKKCRWMDVDKECLTTAGHTEDQWMWSCMAALGAKHVPAKELLHNSPCLDDPKKTCGKPEDVCTHNKVVYHPWKKPDGWGRCWKTMHVKDVNTGIAKKIVNNAIKKEVAVIEKHQLAKKGPSKPKKSQTPSPKGVAHEDLSALNLLETGADVVAELADEVIAHDA